MLYLRGLIFTLLVPCVVAGLVPRLLAPGLHPQPGWWQLGWLPLITGTGLYLLCLLRFLAAGGTPSIYFTRSARWLFGEEPAALVETGLYRYSRNPMYLGVLGAIFGQAILFASPRLALYGAAAFLFFSAVIRWAEEPHLRARHGAAYDAYCRRIPRWLCWPRS